MFSLSKFSKKSTKKISVTICNGLQSTVRRWRPSLKLTSFLFELINLTNQILTLSVCPSSYVCALDDENTRVCARFLLSTQHKNEKTKVEHALNESQRGSVQMSFDLN